MVAVTLLVMSTVLIVVLFLLVACASAALVAVSLRLAALQTDLVARVDVRDDVVGRQLELRNAGVETQVAEMRRTMGEVAGLVDRLQTDRAVQHREMMAHLEDSARSHAVLASAAAGLRGALANPRARGVWGERTAEDLLRRAGLIEGVSYQRQQQLAGGTRPDYTFLLPGERRLHMDVKFPADNYLRYLEADTDLDRERHRRQFLIDVRLRLKELSGRDYVDRTDTVDYLLLFVPNESVYGFICEHEPNLVDLALGQRIILCSPFTLFAVLAVVRQAVEVTRLERRTDEVLSALSSFSGQWDRFGDSLDKVDRHLAMLQNSFGELSGPRRRQLQRTLDSVDRIELPADRNAVLSATQPTD